MAALSVFGGLGLSACSDSDDTTDLVMDDASSNFISRLGFDSIMGSRLDAAVVPEGYKAQVLAPWGTPLNSRANPWREDGTNSSEDQLNSVGMHHDGMHFFPIDGSSTNGLLCINHEYIDANALHPNGPSIDEAAGRRTVGTVCKMCMAGVYGNTQRRRVETFDEQLLCVRVNVLDVFHHQHDPL